MSDLQEFVSAKTGYQYQPQWPSTPSIEYPPQDVPTESVTYNIPTLVHPTFASKTWHELARESLYERLLHMTPSGYQADFPPSSSNFGYLRRRLNASNDAVKNSVDMNLLIMHGNPVFRGTRIPVYQIIEELADGTPLREIPEGYPSLTMEQIQNGLDFAATVLRIYDEQIPHR